MPKTEDDKKETHKDELKSETPVNGIIDGKTEPELHSEHTTKSHNIKEETVEVSDTTASTVTTESSSASLCSSVKSERNEEVKRNTAEDIQQALKNDQQAKIPLKKRGMKFSEDFDKSSSITVQTPAVTPVKETFNSDTAPEQTKTALNDHVNGDIQPALEKDLQSRLSEPLKDTSAHKGQNTESATGKSAAGRENESPCADQEGMQDEQDRDESTELVPSHQAELDTKDTQSERETTVPTKRESHESAESPPLLKDVNHAETLKSSNHEKHETAMEERVETCTEDKTSSEESDKTLTIGESGHSQLNHEAIPKETETTDSEDKTDCVDMDSSESKQMEETKTPSLSDIKQADVSETDAKHMDTCEMNVEKSNNSHEKVDFKTETESGVTDSEKKADDSENTASPPVTKMTETLNDGENTDTAQKVIECSTVNKIADQPVITDEAKELSNIKESVELSPIEGAIKSETCKPAEKQCNIKDEEMAPKKNGEPSESDTETMGNTDKTEKPDDTNTSVNCKDSTIHDVTTVSDSEPRLSEAVAVKQDLTKPQQGDKIEMNYVAHETTEETSEGKGKASSPVEKTEVSEEPDHKADKEEKLSEEQQDQTETDHTSSESKPDADEVSKQDTDNENVQKAHEEQPCANQDVPQDSRQDESSITDETKEEEHKNTETSMDVDESAHENVSKGPDAKSSGDTETPDHPSEEPDTDKSTDEQSKSKSGKQDLATEKEVTNGDEARSHVQVVGGRQKTKPPALRRKAELQREERQGDSESDTNAGRSLRRSPRISRPTPKAVEIHDKKIEKPQAASPADKNEKDKDEKDDEEEEEEEVLVKAVQKKPREKKPDQEGQPKPKVRLLTVSRIHFLTIVITHWRIVPVVTSADRWEKYVVKVTA